jgi:hypothetical protein
MFSNMTGELARVRQTDLLATAQHHRLVREARHGRASRPADTVRSQRLTAPAGRVTVPIRHGAAAVLLAAARRLEPVRRGLESEAVGLAPELPRAAEPC